MAFFPTFGCNFIFIQDISKSLLHSVWPLWRQCADAILKFITLFMNVKCQLNCTFFPVPLPLDVPIHVSEVYNDPDILFVVYVC